MNIDEMVAVVTLVESNPCRSLLEELEKLRPKKDSSPRRT